MQRSVSAQFLTSDVAVITGLQVFHDLVFLFPRFHNAGCSRIDERMGGFLSRIHVLEMRLEEMKLSQSQATDYLEQMVLANDLTLKGLINVVIGQCSLANAQLIKAEANLATFQRRIQSRPATSSQVGRRFICKTRKRFSHYRISSS